MTCCDAIDLMAREMQQELRQKEWQKEFTEIKIYVSRMQRAAAARE